MLRSKITKSLMRVLLSKSINYDEWVISHDYEIALLESVQEALIDMADSDLDKHILTNVIDGPYSHINIYTDTKLSNFINSKLCNVKEERDFVQQVKSYITSDEDKILGIKGLRSTGKTVGILQAISNVAECAYIEITDFGCITLQWLLELLETDRALLSKRVIVIDEVSNVLDVIEKSKGFDGYRAVNNKRLILSGTNSYTLVLMDDDALFHRMRLIDVSFISYKEAVRTQELTLSEYLSNGGIYPTDIDVSTPDGALNYLNIAVVKNVTDTLSLNTKRLSSLGDGAHFYGREREFRTIVFVLFYAVIFQQFTKSLTTLKAAIDFGIAELNRQDFMQKLQQQFDIDINYVPQDEDIFSAIRILKDIEVLHEVSNLTSTPYKSRYYICNPVLHSKLIDAISTDYLLPTRVTNSQLGTVLESSVIIHLLKFSCQEVNFYDSGNFELDAVIHNYNTCKIIEVKAKQDIDEALASSKSFLRADNEVQVRDNVCEKLFICLSDKEYICNGINEDNIKNVKVKQQYKDLKDYCCDICVVPADKFLLNTEYYANR